MRRPIDPHYDVAQVCRRGHVANSCFVDFPEHNKRFCSECGKETITACDRCHAPIRGLYRGGLTVRPFEAPAHCQECGAPYPWTAAGLVSAQALADELEGLDDAERIALRASLEDIVIESPQAAVAAVRIKRTMMKAKGPVRELLVGVLKSIVVDSVKPYFGF